MKLTGPACTEALNEAEEAGRRERARGSAGGVRVERRVRPRMNYLDLLKTIKMNPVTKTDTMHQETVRGIKLSGWRRMPE
jgi:hypothetical protein